MNKGNFGSLTISKMDTQREGESKDKAVCFFVCLFFVSCLTSKEAVRLFCLFLQMGNKNKLFSGSTKTLHSLENAFFLTLLFAN